MAIRKHLSLLLVILLVISMTSQAASAYVMSCQGTTSCCCMAPTPGMNMNGVMPGGMGQDCCETTPSQPCDIETTPQTAALPFLPCFVTGSVDSYMAAGMIATIVDPAVVSPYRTRQAEDFANRGGPPIYLQTQTFLC